jgi:hypothetical protein
MPKNHPNRSLNYAWDRPKQCQRKRKVKGKAGCENPWIVFTRYAAASGNPRYKGKNRIANMKQDYKSECKEFVREDARERKKGVRFACDFASRKDFKSKKYAFRRRKYVEKEIKSARDRNSARRNIRETAKSHGWKPMRGLLSRDPNARSGYNI